MLALTAQSPDIEHLNEVSLKLPLSDVAVKTLQNVNRQWIRATATALERCRLEHPFSVVVSIKVKLTASAQQWHC